MELYDKTVSECMELLAGYSPSALYAGDAGSNWPDAGNDNLILRSEMAYELGGSGLAAVSGLAFTSSTEFVAQDEILLYGPDLPQIHEDRAYARLVFLRVAEEEFAEKDAAYSILRKIEYTRYHMNPYGYMMRISTASEREPVRIGAEALQQGMNFEKIGQLFLRAYHEHPQVEAVKLIYITLPDFPYEQLHQAAGKMQKITESLNHIFKDLKMDCSICNLKPVCDEVEGMRQQHFRMIKD